MIARLSKSDSLLKDATSDLISFLLEGFTELFPVSAICSFSTPTLKILVGILQNMFKTQQPTLCSFSCDLLLKVHLSLPFEDLAGILCKILSQESINPGKLGLNVMMLVRAFEKADTPQIRAFLGSPDCNLLLRLSSQRPFECL